MWSAFECFLLMMMSQMDAKATLIQKVHFTMKNDLKAFHYSPSTHAMSSQRQKLSQFSFFENIFQLNSLNYGLLGRLMPGDTFFATRQALFSCFDQRLKLWKARFEARPENTREKVSSKKGSAGKGLLCWRANNLLLSDFPRRWNVMLPCCCCASRQFRLMQKWS